MAEFDGISEFLKSGPGRLKDAEELLQRPTLDPNEQGAETRHLQGAIYLAGYGVECLLKAYFISRQRNCESLSDARDAVTNSGKQIRDICGAAGHDLRYLLSLTDLEDYRDKDKREQMAICAKWSSSLRYNPKPVHDRNNTITRVEAARRLVNWISAQI